MPESPQHSVSVAGAVIRDDGRALVIQRRDNGRWEPPGGILEHGETVHAGLVREVEEETGLVVEPEALTGVYQNMTRDVIALVFRCRVVAGTTEPTSEATAFAWLTPDEISDRLTEAFAVRLLDALADTRTPAVRIHDGRQLLNVR